MGGRLAPVPGSIVLVGVPRRSGVERCIVERRVAEQREHHSGTGEHTGQSGDHPDEQRDPHPCGDVTQRRSELASPAEHRRRTQIREDVLEVPLRSSPDARGEIVLDLPRRRLDLGRSVAVMGIVNVTPDSFYDGGATLQVDEAVARALQLAEEGAAIVDIGGVKGGPGEEVTAAEELARVIPVIEEVRSRSDVVISVDTYRAPVAAAALTAGADVVNDVGGGDDPEVVAAAGDHGAGYIAMHRSGPPRTRPFRNGYVPDVTTAVAEHLGELAEAAVEAGVERGRIVIDPGHDFHKTTWHSLELTRNLPTLTAMGYPVLVALSNKDFVGESIGAALDRRVGASLAAAVFAILRGASIIRVHEVARSLDAVRITEALLGWRSPAVAVRGLE